MLSKFPNKTLKIGAKVSLSPQTNWNGSGPTHNPVGRIGWVLRKSFDGVHVWWGDDPADAGVRDGHPTTHNWYRYDDYDLIAEGEPGFLSTR